MIYTVTFNPAIDYVVQLEHLTQGTVNRTGDEAAVSYTHLTLPTILRV